MDKPCPGQPRNDRVSNRFVKHFAAAPNRERRRATPGVVLVVEDDWLLRQSVADDLTAEGWTVLEAESGESALTTMRDEADIDLLVTDIRLGGHIDGWDVAEAMRRKDADLPVIYVSANPALTSRQVEGSIFLSKPYMSSKLLDACRSLCGPKPQ